MKTLVIIPTYNEKENIENIIRTIFSIDSQYHLLIIDDGSPDGTAKIIKKLQSAFNNQLFIIERPSKLGLGTAYITGFKWALENNYDFIFEMDADFSHDPKDLPRLLNACKDNNYDLSIGSRYVKGGKVENWPKTRWLMSYFASIYVRVILLMLSLIHI